MGGTAREEFQPSGGAERLVPFPSTQTRVHARAETHTRCSNSPTLDVPHSSVKSTTTPLPPPSGFQVLARQTQKNETSITLNI